MSPGETDENLLKRYRAGDFFVADILLERYKNLVRKKANTLFLFGGDTDDLIQEGMIGLFKAIQNYEPDKGTFASFAQICMNNQMYHAIEAAARKKHTPLNRYVSLSESGDSGADYSEGTWGISDLSPDSYKNPEQILIDRESVEQILTDIRGSLSEMELAVLTEYLGGLNYRQIAEKMEKPPKVIDNALQRIRTKVMRIVEKQQN